MGYHSNNSKTCCYENDDPHIILGNNNDDDDGDGEWASRIRVAISGFLARLKKLT